MTVTSQRSLAEPTPAVPGRRRRLLPAAAVLVAAATLLSACDKPRPSVTVYSGSTARSVQAQAPCVIAGSCNADVKKVVDLAAAPGSTILIDVPKNLAASGWIAAAYTSDASGKNTPVQGAGTPGASGKLAVRVQVPQATGGYLLQISSVRPTNQLTTWIVRVAITA